VETALYKVVNGILTMLELYYIFLSSGNPGLLGERVLDAEKVLEKLEHLWTKVDGKFTLETSD
jgi:hypothetical protein